MYENCREQTCVYELMQLISEGDLRGRANMAQIRQSRPDSGLGFQVNVLQPFRVVPSSLGSAVEGAGSPPQMLRGAIVKRNPGREVQNSYSTSWNIHFWRVFPLESEKLKYAIFRVNFRVERTLEVGAAGTTLLPNLPATCQNIT